MTNSVTIVRSVAARLSLLVLGAMAAGVAAGMMVMSPEDRLLSGAGVRAAGDSQVIAAMRLTRSLMQWI